MYEVAFDSAVSVWAVIREENAEEIGKWEHLEKSHAGNFAAWRLGREKRLGKEFLAEGFAPFLQVDAPGGEEAPN